MQNTKIPPPKQMSGCLSLLAGCLLSAGLLVLFPIVLLPFMGWYAQRGLNVPHDSSPDEAIGTTILVLFAILGVIFSLAGFVLLKISRPFRCGTCGARVSKRANICCRCELHFE